jgi:hypothetical protein
MAVAVLVLGCVPGAAEAYVRSTARSGRPFTWPSRCINVIADGRGSRDVPIDILDAVLARSTENWMSRIGSCGYIELTARPHDRARDVAIDGQPVLVFRDDKWERDGMARDPSAIAITRVFHVVAPGTAQDAIILDADIEMNGVNYTFITSPDQPPRAGTTIADLENTLTHELGHVLGLGHTCWDDKTKEPPLDNRGMAALDCNGALPDEVVEATMYPYSSSPGETSKRSVTDDDVAGVCDVYPAAATPPGCYPTVSGGCAVGGERAPAGFVLVGALAMLGVALTLARVRSRR